MFLAVRAALRQENCADWMYVVCCSKNFQALWIVDSYGRRAFG